MDTSLLFSVSHKIAEEAAAKLDTKVNEAILNKITFDQPTSGYWIHGSVLEHILSRDEEYKIQLDEMQKKLCDFEHKWLELALKHQKMVAYCEVLQQKVNVMERVQDAMIGWSEMITQHVNHLKNIW